VSAEEIFKVHKVALAFSAASRIAFESGQMQVSSVVACIESS
jgi:hypothetical protein